MGDNTALGRGGRGLLASTSDGTPLLRRENWSVRPAS
jgi:hypothetical protein